MDAVADETLENLKGDGISGLIDYSNMIRKIVLHLWHS